MTAEEIYKKHTSEALQKGKSRADAHLSGLRHVNHAGFFKGPSGWKQLHPDLRDKVNMREAIPQPDGTFAIYDVDAFLPNAVKGENEVYDAKRILRIIDNTNGMIAAGGQKPGLLEGHPSLLQAMNGMQMDSHGHPINWRKSPRGAGWARCDIVHVDPEMIDRLKKKKLTGLSAYVAKDAGSLNERFGHVALLGGSTQALSSLPMHDVYASCCFSADAAFFQGEQIMLNDKQKKCFDAAVKAGVGYAAAEASFGAKEPGADMKMKQAKADCFSAAAAFKASFDDMSGDAGGMAPQQDVPQFDADGKRKDLPAEAELSLTDQTEAQKMEFSAGGFDLENFDDAALAQLSGQFSSGQVEPAFMRMGQLVQSLAKARKTDKNEIHRVKLANQALQGKLVAEDYKAFCAGLRNEGFQIEASTEKDMFAFAMTNANPKAGLESAKAMLRKMPKVESLAGIEQVFSSNDGAPRLKPGTSNQVDTDAMMTELSEMTGRDFSEADLRIGAAFSAGLV